MCLLEAALEIANHARARRRENAAGRPRRCGRGTGPRSSPENRARPSASPPDSRLFALEERCGSSTTTRRCAAASRVPSWRILAEQTGAGSACTIRGGGLACGAPCSSCCCSPWPGLPRRRGAGGHDRSAIIRRALAFLGLRWRRRAPARRRRTGAGRRDQRVDRHDRHAARRSAGRVRCHQRRDPPHRRLAREGAWAPQADAPRPADAAVTRFALHRPISGRTRHPRQRLARRSRPACRC